jgi:NAD(P)-dependent dehydrogenase (short-subunit alcohol dehydrogenase family)
VAGERLQRVLEGRAQASGQTVEQVTERAMASQSIKRLVDPRDIAAVAVFLASDAGKAISGQLLPVDNDLQMI